VAVGRLDQVAVKALMRAFHVVMSHVLADEFSQVRLTQRDGAVDARLRVLKALESRKISADRVATHYGAAASTIG
jgi:hypothetical protein